MSGKVALVGYDHFIHTLWVTFRSGGTYDCHNVPVFLYDAMLLSHPWRRVGRQLRADRYRRIGA